MSAHNQVYVYPTYVEVSDNEYIKSDLIDKITKITKTNKDTTIECYKTQLRGDLFVTYTTCPKDNSFNNFVKFLNNRLHSNQYYK